MDILITGPRKLTPEEHSAALHRLQEIGQQTPNAHWHVGCANGVDAIARQTCNPDQLTVYRVQNRTPWELQARSKRMVDSNVSGTLYAFPNKNCPENITLSSWKGSGTWGTIFYAHSKGLKVELNWLIDDYETPDFLLQLKLF